MAKLNSLLKGILAAQQALAMLQAMGIDIDRLIGISNAQGPQAKLIQGLLSGSLDRFIDSGEFDGAFAHLGENRLLLQSATKPKKTRKKGKPPS